MGEKNQTNAQELKDNSLNFFPRVKNRWDISICSMKKKIRSMKFATKFLPCLLSWFAWWWQRGDGWSSPWYITYNYSVSDLSSQTCTKHRTQMRCTRLTHAPVLLFCGTGLKARKNCLFSHHFTKIKKINLINMLYIHLIDYTLADIFCRFIGINDDFSQIR